MPKSAPGQYNFSGGEISPTAQGNVDQPWYKKSLDTALNMIPLIQGGITRRPGTRHLAPVKDSANPPLLAEFPISVTQSYVLEIGYTGGAGYIRFYRNEAQILSAGIPYEIVAPWALADLSTLRFAQNGFDLYIVHPSYAPRKLTCTNDTSFALSTVAFIDGPYLPTNKTGSNIASDSVIVGTPANLTVGGGVAGINNGSGFLPTDVGRLVSITSEVISTFTEKTTTLDYPDMSGSDLYAPGKNVPTKGRTVYRITAYVSNTHVVATVVRTGAVGSGLASAKFNLGLWSVTTGYPSYVTLHEGRLWMSGCPATLKRLDASVSGTTEDFTPDDTGESGLPVVTDSSALDFTLNSRDASVIQWMEADEKGLLIGSGGDEWTFRPSTLSAATTPTNVDAKPATFYGCANVAPVKVGKAVLFVERYTKKIREMGFYFEVNGYRAPNRTLYADHITGPTGITKLTYQREPQAIVWALRADGVLAGMTHEEENGVVTTGWHRHVLGGTAARVLSMAVAGRTDGSRDQLYMTVQRTINGATKVYVEVMQKIFTIFDLQTDAWFVDSGITYSNATPFTSVGGLGHLEGQTVVVWGDGAPRGSYVVSGGIAGPWDGAVTQVQVGLDYNSDGKMLRLESGSANGTALGKLRRTHRVGFLLHQFGPRFTFGTDFSNMTYKDFRTTDMAESEAVPLFSGIICETLESDYDFDNKICWRINDGMPGTILAVMPRMDTQDAE